jgi:hypothetical protein
MRGESCISFKSEPNNPPLRIEPIGATRLNNLTFVLLFLLLELYDMRDRLDSDRLEVRDESAPLKEKR